MIRQTSSLNAALYSLYNSYCKLRHVGKIYYWTCSKFTRLVSSFSWTKIHELDRAHGPRRGQLSEFWQRKREVQRRFWHWQKYMFHLTWAATLEFPIRAAFHHICACNCPSLGGRELECRSLCIDRIYYIIGKHSTYQWICAYQTLQSPRTTPYAGTQPKRLFCLWRK